MVEIFRRRGKHEEREKHVATDPLSKFRNNGANEETEPGKKSRFSSLAKFAATFLFVTTVPLAMMGTISGCKKNFTSISEPEDTPVSDVQNADVQLVDIQLPDAEKDAQISDYLVTDTGHEGLDTAPPVKTCAQKEAEDTKTFYIISLDGNKTKVQDGEMVEEDGQKYKVAIVGDGAILKAVGDDGSGHLELKPYKLNADGEIFFVKNGDMITDEAGETWTVTVTEQNGILSAKLVNENGVEKEVDSIESSDVKKDTTLYTSSHYSKSFVLAIAGQSSLEIGPEKVILPETDEGKHSVTGMNGTKLTFWIKKDSSGNEIFDENGNLILEYSYEQSGNTKVGEVPLALGSVILANELSAEVILDGDKNEGDKDCKTQVAGVRVKETGEDNKGYSIPEGEKVAVNEKKTTVENNDTVTGTGKDGPFGCANITVETPTENGGVSTNKTVCIGDGGIKIENLKDGSKTTVELEKVQSVPGEQAKAEAAQQ